MVDIMQNKNAFKLFNCLLAVILILAIVPVATFAAQLSGISSEISQDTKTVVIKGTHSGGEGRLVTISVAKENTPSVIYYWAEKKTVANGFFEFKYDMDAANDITGYYNVNIGGTNVTPYKDSYLFINEDEDTNITTSINSFTSADQVKTLLNEKDYLCNINMGIDSKFNTVTNKTAVYTAMIGRSFANITMIKKAFDEAVAIVKLNESSIVTAERIISDYAADLSIDIGSGSYYSLIRNSVGKNIVYSAVVGKNFSLKKASEVKEIFEAVSALGLINDIDTTNRDKLITYIEELNQKGYTSISTSIYNSFKDTDKNNVIKKTIDSKPYSTFYAFEKAFSDAVEDIKNDISSGGGGGGGGGSGSSKPTTVITGEIVPVQTPESSSSFNDIEGVEWAKESINYLADKNIINGDGNHNFDPNRNITRSEFVKILVNALKITNRESDLTNLSFTDVNPSMWQYEFIAIAKGKGFVNGVSETEFGINDLITREQMCSMVYRSLLTQGIQISTTRDAIKFNDNNNISNYANEAVAFLYSANIVNGIEDNIFAPANTATRAMAAKIIYEVIERGGLK